MLTNPSHMTFALVWFHVFLPWVNACLASCLNSVLNVKAVVAAFNQEKALVVALSVIVQLCRIIANSSSIDPPGSVLARPLYARVPGILVGLGLLASDNPGAGPVHHPAAALRPCTV